MTRFKAWLWSAVRDDIDPDEMDPFVKACLMVGFIYVGGGSFAMLLVMIDWWWRGVP